MVRRKLRRNRNKKQVHLMLGMVICLLMIMTVGYAAFSTNITLNAKGNVKEKSRIIRSWTSDSVDDFHNSQYRENIVSVTFLDSTTLPSNVDKSWDVSEDGKGGVIAYVKINEEDRTKYDLFIGAKDGVIANENSANIFRNFTNVTQIEFNNNFNTDNVVNMGGFFAFCGKLSTIDLSKFNTVKVENMSAMFQGCTNLISLDLSSFNTSNVKNMKSLCNGCKSLTYLNVNNLNTSNVTDMGSMFGAINGNANIDELNLCGFDTSKVTDMSYMFAYSTKIKKVYVGNKWNTSNANMTNFSLDNGVTTIITNKCKTNN